MNITDNPNYKYMTTQNNPYLSVLTFSPTTNTHEINLQVTFLLNVLCFVTNAVPYILTHPGKNVGPDGKKIPSAFYNDIMNEVENNPISYNCTKKELYRAYSITFEVMNLISDEYRTKKIVNSDIFQYGLTLLNDTFLEDVFNEKVNKRYFVDGMLKMSKSLERFKK